MIKGSRRRATAFCCALILSLIAAPLAGQSSETGSSGETEAASQTGSASSSAASTAASAATALIKPEAPSSIFQASLGGADTELLLKGSWEASLLSTLGVQVGSGGGLSFDSTQPLLFTQVPEIYLKLLLYKRYFVEARVSNDVTQALYDVGYQGGEGELLQEVRIGNNDISFPQLPYLSFGEGSYRSFGAMARINTGDFEGHAMVRYDQAERVTKHFVGTSEVTDTVLSPNAFIAGKYFVTRVSPTVADFVVYVQSTSGTLSGSDGKKYRKLDSSEFAYSVSTGLITLASAATTRVAVSYTGAGSGSTSSTPPETITVGSDSCDLLYAPDYTSSSDTLDPLLEVLCRYSTTADASSSSVFVRNKSTGLKDSSYGTRIDSAGYVEVTYDSYTNPQDSTNGVYFRQPFYSTMSWLYTTDFSSDATSTTYAPVYDHEIVVRTYGTSAYITIDKDLIPGSVEVYRNGVPDYAFSVDTENGRLILASPPGLAEEITVTYLLETSERRSGSLVAGLGGIWTPSKDQSMWTALGLRWSVPGSSYAAGGTTNPGTITLTAGEKKTGGAFVHKAALAATYTQEEASGRYRMESMESDSGYTTGFRPADTTNWDGTLEQVEDTDLKSGFPTLMNELHADGSTQLALEVIGATVNTYQVDCSRVETLPAYEDFKTFAFFLKKVSTSSTATVTVSIDDGSSGDNFITVAVPLSGLKTGWNKILYHYGRGDSAVYFQSSESGSEVALSAASASVNMSNISFSRLHITTTSLGDSEVFWVDEVLLEDSVGVAAANFQGNLAYSDPHFVLGGGSMPLLKGISVKADSSAGLSNDSFASGGGSVATTLGPLGLALNARASASESASPYLRGGHEFILPAGSSPAKLDDQFDFDPSTGAFGRQDSLALQAPSIASVDLFQRSAWSPGADSTEGLLTQEWKGALGLGNGLFSADLDATNRARPTQVATGSGYGNAWISGFAYALPAYESDAELRSEKMTVKLRLSPDAEIASATLGTSVEPQSTTSEGTGLRDNSAVMRLTLPLLFKGLKVRPYYQRSWTDERNGCADNLVDDANRTLEDLAGVSMLYTSSPFSEIWDSATETRFASQTSPDGTALPAGTYTPEAGISLSRDSGSSWIDLLAPSTLAFAYRRVLTRSDSTITDATVWDTTMKFSAVNVFGLQGAYPLGLPFDSDEYYSTLQATITKYVGESADRLSLTSQNLATLYKGEAQSLTAENRFSISTAPSKNTWTETCRADLSWKVARHWLLSLYQMVVPQPAPTSALPAPSSDAASADAPAGGAQRPSGGSSIVSLYLKDLQSRKPNLRSSFEVALSLSDTLTDESAPPVSWEFDETYIAKLTVPERLTVSAKGGLKQEYDGTTDIYLFDLILGIDLTISF